MEGTNILPTIYIPLQLYIYMEETGIELKIQAETTGGREYMDTTSRARRNIGPGIEGRTYIDIDTDIDGTIGAGRLQAIVQNSKYRKYLEMETPIERLQRLEEYARNREDDDDYYNLPV